MAKFVQPRSEKAVMIHQDEEIRVVKTRTQIQTGEWNKELIIEFYSGTDALGADRWVELSGSSTKHIWKKFPHQVNWQLMKTLSTIICDEEAAEDYDYIFYINKGRYRVKGQEREEEL